MPIPEHVAQLRTLVGHTELWMPGVTAVVRRGDDVLLVERSDNGAWTPVTGIVDPREDPGVAARREALEETGVEVRVERLARVGVVGPVEYANGDRASYLDLTFACSWVAGEPYAADDESTDARWWSLADLPPMSEDMLDRIDAALAVEERARFVA